MALNFNGNFQADDEQIIQNVIWSEALHDVINVFVIISLLQPGSVRARRATLIVKSCVHLPSLLHRSRLPNLWCYKHNFHLLILVNVMLFIFFLHFIYLVQQLSAFTRFSMLVMVMGMGMVTLVFFPEYCY